MLGLELAEGQQRDGVEVNEVFDGVLGVGLRKGRGCERRRFVYTVGRVNINLKADWRFLERIVCWVGSKWPGLLVVVVLGCAPYRLAACPDPHEGRA